MNVFSAIRSIFTKKAYKIVGLDITKQKIQRFSIGLNMKGRNGKNEINQIHGR